MPNRLAQENSPYLLQHQNNPVDWFPWGPEALELARKLERPIFLSIGYSACHWCHVMEHESFEDPQIAARLNANFISIKVDREERPDLDQIYMSAVQMLTGRGGWPMSVFLTPELKPFYGGTYWPPTSRHGLPGFTQVIDAVAAAWQNNRAAAIDTADELTQEIGKAAAVEGAVGELTRELVEQAGVHLARTFDRVYGGFGGAPKFPAPLALRLLMRRWHRNRDQAALDMVQTTLDRMAAGGIYDHLGGGFARYSVDAQWLVPHFEKMLYDNAQLVLAYLEAYQITGREEYAQVVRETVDYVLRDMTDPQGGFYSSEDADSEGVEGKFSTWTLTEMQQVLGREAAATFARVYDVTEGGNFEGSNILHLSKTLVQQAAILKRPVDELLAELAASRAKLLAARELRIHPHKDDKVLVAWNGLMIEACAAVGAVLGEPRYLAAAERAADFVWDQLRRDDGRLLHTWRQGTAKIDAYLDDYACLASGFLSLYEAGFQSRHLDRALELAELILTRFADPTAGGFFFTADDQEQLILRSKEFADNATPCGNAMAAWVLVRLGKLTGRQVYLDAATQTLEAAGELMRRFPSACCQSLLAVDLLLGPTCELVFAGDLSAPATRQSLADLQRRFLPNKVLAVADTNAPAALQGLLAEKTAANGEPTLYVCEGFTCQTPAQGAAEIKRAVARLT